MAYLKDRGGKGEEEEDFMVTFFEGLGGGEKGRYFGERATIPGFCQVN